MTDERLERELRLWLADEAGRLRLPMSLEEDAAAIATAGGLPHGDARVITRSDLQLRSPWPNARSVSMRSPASLLVAAALVVVAVVGAALLRNADEVAAPSGSAAPLVTATPWPSGPDCGDVNPGTPAADTCRIFGWNIVFASGRTPVNVDGVAFTLDVPDTGWESFGNVSLNNGRVGSQGAEAMIYWTAFPGGANVDPCWFSLDMSVGPSVADVASAITRAPGTEVVSQPADVQVGGKAAKYVAVKVLDDFGCTPGYFHLWSEPFSGAFWRAAGVGATIRVWVVDADGTRLFIAGETHADVDPSFGEEIHAIVESLRFE
jgi:hypothetical protein